MLLLTIVQLVTLFLMAPPTDEVIEKMIDSISKRNRMEQGGTEECHTIPTGFHPMPKTLQKDLEKGFSAPQTRVSTKKMI